MNGAMPSAVVAGALVGVHLLWGRLALPGGPPRSSWLSAAGGVSVAYVFLHLMPELHEGQHTLGEAASMAWLVRLGDSGIYLVALVGLTVFHGLERLAMRSRAASRAGGAADRTRGRIFAVHVAAFALYNLVIGYLLVHGGSDNLVLYAAAMALHFIINDHALREHHKERYDRVGRPVLAAAVLVGWLAAQWLHAGAAAVLLLVALLAGGVILNVLKEELPERRESRFSAFLVGAAGYGALLLAL